jgi:hypothetical protein
MSSLVISDWSRFDCWKIYHVRRRYQGWFTKSGSLRSEKSRRIEGDEQERGVHGYGLLLHAGQVACSHAQTIMDTG